MKEQKVLLLHCWLCNVSLQEEIKRGIWEPVEIPDGYKGLIIGKGGASLREISRQTGAEVTLEQGEVHIISGTEEQREHVKVIIGMKVVGRSKNFFFYVLVLQI